MRGLDGIVMSSVHYCPNSYLIAQVSAETISGVDSHDPSWQSTDTICTRVVLERQKKDGLSWMHTGTQIR